MSVARWWSGSYENGATRGEDPSDTTKRRSVNDMCEKSTGTESPSGASRSNNESSASSRWGVSGSAAAHGEVLVANGSGSEELKELLEETIAELDEAAGDDQIGASLGTVIERAYTQTPHGLGAIGDHVEHLVATGAVYRPEEATLKLIDSDSDGDTEGVAA